MAGRYINAAQHRLHLTAFGAVHGGHLPEKVIFSRRASSVPAAAEPNRWAASTKGLIMKTTPVSFRTTILKTGKNTTGIQIPERIVEELGSGKQPLVRVTINKYSYRSAVAVMSGKFMIALSAEHRQAAGVQGGEEADVTIELDLEPRTVEVPIDLKVALTKADALRAFENSAPSMKKEYVRQVEEAKTQETRERRITRIVERLSGN